MLEGSTMYRKLPALAAAADRRSLSGRGRVREETAHPVQIS